MGVPRCVLLWYVCAVVVRGRQHEDPSAQVEPRLGRSDRESSSAQVSLSWPAGGPSASAHPSHRVVIEDHTIADNLALLAGPAHQSTRVAKRVTFTPQQQAQGAAAPARQPRLKNLLSDSSSQASLECCQEVLTITDVANACLLHVLAAAPCLCFSVLHDLVMF